MVQIIKINTSSSNKLIKMRSFGLLELFTGKNLSITKLSDYQTMYKLSCWTRSDKSMAWRQMSNQEN